MTDRGRVMDPRRVLDSESLASGLKRGEKCLVCLSGGADSVALLRALLEWRGSARGLEALHVNHLVRGAAANADAEFCRDLCERLGVAFHVREITPLARKPVGMTTEEYFRAQRHGRIIEVAASRQIDKAALGHTADDLAETFLMHLLRGSGLHGLSFAFSQDLGGVTVLRPLWQTPRHRVLNYLRSLGQTFRDDESNASLEFTRNRIRHRLIPMLEAEFNPSVRDALRRAANLIALAEADLRGRARKALRRLGRTTSAGWEMQLAGFVRLPRILRMELCAEWLKAAGALSPSYRQIEAILRVAGSDGARSLHLSRGLMLVKEDERLVLIRSDELADDGEGTEAEDRVVRELLARESLAANPDLPLARMSAPVVLGKLRPGESAHLDVELLNGARMRLNIRLGRDEELPLGADVAGGHAGPLTLVVRNRRPGDRVSASVRLKSVLINDRVPFFLRDFLILVTDEAHGVRAVVGLPRLAARIRHTDRLRVEVDCVPVG